MKRLVLGLISLMVLIGLNGCSDKPEDSLNNSIQEYKECMINNDTKPQNNYDTIYSFQFFTI